MVTSLDVLFPVPGPPPSRLCPPHWPGVSPESTQALQTALKDNHKRWHTFINEKHFHNHAPHRSLAIWGLGADGEVITAGYEKDCGYEKPAVPPPGKITEHNLTEHLGDERYYGSYVEFFADSVLKQGIAQTLEEYLFSAKANIGHTKDLAKEKQPRMMARLFSGVVHPLIHTGYGLEFGLPGMVAEGLAQTAVHAPATDALIPSSLFKTSMFNSLHLSQVAASAGRGIREALKSTVDTLDSALDTAFQKSLHLGTGALRPKKNAPSNDQGGSTVHVQTEDRVPIQDVHVLDILGWVAEDLRFAPVLDSGSKDSFDQVIGKHAHVLVKFADLWRLDSERLGNDENYLEGKIEELAWLVTVMYGIGGWTGRSRQPGTPDEHFNADFFLMHLVTSSIFIPSFTAIISPASRARFLHTYLVVALAMYVFRGCPSLDIAKFQKLADIPPSGPQPHPSKDTLPSPDSPKAVNPDPWYSILQTSIVHPDEHLTKSQRSLSNWASHFGTRSFTSASTSKLAPHGQTIPQDNPTNVHDVGDDAEAEAAGLGMGWGLDAPSNRASEDHSSATGPATPGPAITSAYEGPGPVPLELAGAEYLDGNLFLRTAELTASRLGRVREGEPTGPFWDFSGFFVSRNGERRARL